MIESYVSSHGLSLLFIHFTGFIDKVTEPNSFIEASKDENWVSAMKDEIVALESNNTWTIVSLL